MFLDGTPSRCVTNPKTYVIEIGTDGFNAYQKDGEKLTLFAASSSMSTFLRVMETIVNSNGNKSKVEFSMSEEVSK